MCSIFFYAFTAKPIGVVSSQLSNVHQVLLKGSWCLSWFLCCNCKYHLVYSLGSNSSFLENQLYEEVVFYFERQPCSLQSAKNDCSKTLLPKFINKSCTCMLWFIPNQQKKKWPVVCLPTFLFFLVMKPECYKHSKVFIAFLLVVTISTLQSFCIITVL